MIAVGFRLLQLTVASAGLRAETQFFRRGICSEPDGSSFDSRKSIRGLPSGEQWRREPIMMIPESPCPSLYDDGSVGADSEFVRASPALESRGLPLDSGYGGAKFVGWRGNGKVPRC